VLNFIIGHHREIATLTAEHLWLVSVSMALAIVVGVPLGIRGWVLERIG
jgi:ABC-type proline/glycine betaine transport system permease subunit